MSHFYEIWRYLLKVFKCWEKMDVIRDFFINYKKPVQFLHNQLDSLFEDNITNQILATFSI